MKGYLIDTNVLSELRKTSPSEAVVRWLISTSPESLFVSVLTLGELSHGVEVLRSHDSTNALYLERWIATIQTQFADRILGVDLEVAKYWAKISPQQPLGVIDGLLAATAIAHDLCVATRNTKDFERSGVELINPFAV